MAKGISIGIGSETREFSKGVKNGVIEPLEDAADSLVDLAKQGDKSGENLEDAMREAQKETDELAGKHKELADTIAASSKHSSRAMVLDSDESTEAAKKDLKEVGEEAGSTAKETAASFDGSADSIVGAFQEVAANAFAGFGPAGMIAGLAAAAGIGLVMAQFQKADEENEKFKEHVQELADELMDAGQDGQVSLGYIVDKLKEMASQTDDSKLSLRKIRDEAKELNVPFKDLAETYAGGTEHINEQREAIEKAIKAEQQRADETVEHSTGEVQAHVDKIKRLEGQRDALDRVSESTKQARQDQADWLAAGGPEMQRKVEQIDAINSAYDDAAGAADDFIDKESGLFDVSKYLKSMQEREQAIRDYQDTLASSPLTPEAKAFLNSQGVESAAQFLQGYKKATPAQQAELNRIWSEAGKENSGQYTSALQKGIPGSMPGPVIIPTIDMSLAEAHLAQFTQRRRDIEVGVRYRNGKAVI